MSDKWKLECHACGWKTEGDALATVCQDCGQPLLVRHEDLRSPRESLAQSKRWDMWRYARQLPLHDGEAPVSLGEGGTPLINAPKLATAIGVTSVWVKDEGLNPTGSFKARGMSAAVTRAKAHNVPGLVVPTAGNAGAALAAYAAAAGMKARVYAPETTPRGILATIRALGAELCTLPGHIGDSGKAARAFAAEHGWFDVSTLREPYRIEGKKTLGYEIAEQLGFELPDVIVYPTGGGTGLIGMWKAFAEMQEMYWTQATTLPRMITAQSSGCAPIVRAFAAGKDRAEPWQDPKTIAAGLRVPGPLGDRLILRALRESNGDAGAVDDLTISLATAELSHATGIDASPEGGCALAVCKMLVKEGRISRTARVVLFNTGSGAGYRD